MFPFWSISRWYFIHLHLAYVTRQEMPMTFNEIHPPKQARIKKIKKPNQAAM